jgi:hypothetical protein
MPEAVLSEAQLGIFEFARGCGLQTPSAEDIARTLEDLRKVQGPALIIGGIAVIHHGYERFTKDIDILYNEYHDPRILERLAPYFKVVLKAASGWHHLEHRKTHVRLELVPEGGLGTYGFIPSAGHVRGEGGLVSLLGLVWLKMVSGRIQDEADVAVLAKARMAEVSALGDQLPPELRERHAELVARAKRELETDPNLHPELGAPPVRPPGVQEEAARYGRRGKRARAKR